MKRLLVLLPIACAVILTGQVIDTSPRTGNSGTSLPGSCTAGQQFQKTNATSGAQWYLCESPNTWVAQGATNPNTVLKNQANTYSGGGLQDFSSAALKPPTTTVASLPAASGATNQVYLVLDGASSSDCTTGSGSTRVLCSSNGTAWSPVAGGSGSGASPGGTSGQLQTNNGSGGFNGITISGDSTLNSTTGFMTNTGLQTKPVSATAPTTGQMLQFNGTQWAPTTINGGTGTPGGSTYDLQINSGAGTFNGSSGNLAYNSNKLFTVKTAAAGGQYWTAFNGNALNGVGDPNDHSYIYYDCSTDSMTGNFAFDNENCFEMKFTAQHGQGTYGTRSQVKKTFIPFTINSFFQGSGQKFSLSANSTCYSMSDCAAVGFGVQFAGGPITGDENQGFTTINYLKQQPFLSTGYINAATVRTTCNTYVTAAVNKSTASGLTPPQPQSIPVASSSGCSVNDWVVIAQETPTASQGEWAMQITGVPDSTHIQGVAQSNIWFTTGLTATTTNGGTGLLVSSTPGVLNGHMIIGTGIPASTHALQVGAFTVPTTATSTLGATTITMSDASGVATGMTVSGTGLSGTVSGVSGNVVTLGTATTAAIPIGLVVTFTGSVVQMDQAATASASGVSVSFADTVSPATVVTLNNGATGSFGQDRFLVNHSQPSYTTGSVSAISGAGMAGTGTSWAYNMAGGSPFAIGCIAMTADRTTVSPFNGVYGTANAALDSWYPLTGVWNTNSLSILSKSVAADASYHGYAQSLLHFSPVTSSTIITQKPHTSGNIEYLWGVQVGMTVTANSQSTIPAGTVVTAVNESTGQVTLNNAVTLLSPDNLPTVTFNNPAYTISPCARVLRLSGNTAILENNSFSWNQVSTTGNTTNTSPNISVASATGITNGMIVTGTGIPTNTYVVSGQGTTSLVLSANATATNTGTALVFHDFVEEAIVPYPDVQGWPTQMSLNTAGGTDVGSNFQGGSGRSFMAIGNNGLRTIPVAYSAGAVGGSPIATSTGLGANTDMAAFGVGLALTSVNTGITMSGPLSGVAMEIGMATTTPGANHPCIFWGAHYSLGLCADNTTNRMSFLVGSGSSLNIPLLTGLDGVNGAFGGLPTLVANVAEVDLTAQTGSIGAVEISGPPNSSGLSQSFNACYYISTTTAGTAGTATANFAWTDSSGVSQTFNSPTIALNAVPSHQMGCVPIFLSPGSRFNYSSTVTGNTGSAGVYELHVNIQKLQM